MLCCFFFKQKTAYEMRISDWSSGVCSSDLRWPGVPPPAEGTRAAAAGLAAEGEEGRFVVVMRINIPTSWYVVNANRPTLRGTFVTFRKRLDLSATSPKGELGTKGAQPTVPGEQMVRSEEHTSELQLLMRTSYAVICL